MKTWYALWLVVFLALVCAAILSAGAPITAYLNIPSLIMVVGPAFVLSLGNFSLREMGRAFVVGFKPAEAGRKELELAALFFDGVQRYIIGSGIVGTLVGFTAMLTMLADADRLGASTALALMTVLYGAVIYLALVVPFRTGVRRRLAEIDSAAAE